MKKIFVVFGMIVFIYTTMSVFSGEMNPLLWINPHNEVKIWRLYIFVVEIMFFCMICWFLYTDE